MLFQASPSAPGWAAASPTQSLCLQPPTPGPSPNFFDVPVGLAVSGPAKAPSSVSTDPSVSSPGQPVLLRGRALQVQMTSVSPPSAWPYVLDGPEPDKTSAGRQSHLSPAYIHTCTWMTVHQLGCRAPTPISWCILVFHLSWTLGTLPIATSHTL